MPPISEHFLQITLYYWATSSWYKLEGADDDAGSISAVTEFCMDVSPTSLSNMGALLWDNKCHHNPGVKLERPHTRVSLRSSLRVIFISFFMLISYRVVCPDWECLPLDSKVLWFFHLQRNRNHRTARDGLQPVECTPVASFSISDHVTSKLTRLRQAFFHTTAPLSSEWTRGQFSQSCWFLAKKKMSGLLW